MIYTSYAPIYDAINQGAFAERMAIQVLRQYAVPPLRVLDLACGTGAASLVFAAAGCHVVGVDRSAAMLNLARNSAWQRGLDVTFIEADMRHLEITAASLLVPRSSFNLITCFYDSLNYLLDDDDLFLVFAAVAQLLQPEGRFIFDLNTNVEYEGWDSCDQVIYDSCDHLVYNRLSYNPQQQLATGRIVWFVRNHDRWWRGEETHTERAWRDAEVTAAAQQAGLSIIARRTPTGAPADETAPRVVYEVAVQALQRAP